MICMYLGTAYIHSMYPSIADNILKRFNDYNLSIYNRSNTLIQTLIHVMRYTM